MSETKLLAQVAGAGEVYSGIAVPDGFDVVSAPDWFIVGDGQQVTLDQPMRVTVHSGGSVTVYGPPSDSQQPPTRVYLLGTAKATCHGRVDVLAFDDSQVVAYGEYSAILSGQATGVFYNRGRYQARDTAAVTSYDSVTGSLFNMAVATLHGSSSAWLADMSRAIVESPGTQVIAHHNSLVVITEAGFFGDAPSVQLFEVATCEVPRRDLLEHLRLAPGARVKVTGEELPPVTGYQTGGSPAQDEALAAQAAPEGPGVLAGTSAEGAPSKPMPPAGFTISTAGQALPDTTVQAEQTGAVGDGTTPPVYPYDVDTSEAIYSPGIDPSGAEVPWRPIKGGVPTRRDSQAPSQPNQLPTL